MGKKAFQNEGFLDTSCLKSCTCGGKLLCLSSTSVVCFSLKFVFVCACWLAVVHCILCEPVSMVTYTHTPTHICTQTHTHTCTHTDTCTLSPQTHTHTHTHTCTCTHACPHEHICLHVHTHACMNTHMLQLQKDEFWKKLGLSFSKMDSEKAEFQFGFKGV